MRKVGRSHFNSSQDVQPQEDNQRISYKCFAYDCPMPAAIFYGNDNGVCGWHANEQPSLLPVITKAINDWGVLTKEILRLRRLLVDPATCANVPEHNKAMRHSAAVIRDFTHGVEDLEERTRPKEGELIGQWLQRLENFLTARVKEAITGHPVDETKPTRATAMIRAGLRAVPLKAAK